MCRYLCACVYESVFSGGSADSSGRCRDRGDAPGPTVGLERLPRRLITRQNASDMPNREGEELHVSASFSEHMYVYVFCL